MRNIQLARRSFLVTTASVSLSSCVTCRLPEVSAKEHLLADSHCHFFNAADLPVTNFVKFVIIPQEIPNFPQVALALVDLIGFLAKLFSITARQEIKQIGKGQLFGQSGNPNSREFADAGASHIERNIAKRQPAAFAKSTPLTNLGDSYAYLSTILDIGVSAQSEQSQAASAEADEPFQRLRSIDRKKLQSIAERGQDSETEQSQNTEVGSVEYKRWVERDAGEIRAIIKWAFVMMQSRCSHVLRYLNSLSTANADMAHVANLLVDYDQWLGEQPKNGSRHADQVAFWTRFDLVSSRTAGALRVHTFAGYDPLKHAEEKLSGQSSPGYFDTMQQWVSNGRDTNSSADHKIAGFKLYPPMGFRPDNNIGLSLPAERAGKIVRDRWHKNGWDEAKIGDEIDFALEKFFRFCAREDVPVITHGRESNGASAGSARYADPALWVKRAEMVHQYASNPLRLSIGHFDMNGSDAVALKKLLEMNQSGKAKVYFDIGYDSNILGGNAAYLLSRFAGFGAPVRDYVMFGSDWIMLEQDQSANAYLRNIRQAVEGSDFWRDHSDKLFKTNFLNFLGQGFET